jgi:hypothetical protein
MNSTEIRKSHHIRPRAASRVFKAAKYSENSDRPLNWMVTLNFTHTVCPNKRASQATGEITAKFGRWLRYQSAKAIKTGGESYGAPVYLTVLENPNDIHHVHWLVHVPTSVLSLFEKSVAKWLSKAAGEITMPNGAIDITPVDTVMALSRYLMKGVEKHHAKRCFVRPEDQGIILGKRVAISRSLGFAARQKNTASTTSRAFRQPPTKSISASANFPNTSPP